MMNSIRLLAILLLCTIFCPLYAEDSQTKRTIHVAQAGTLPNLISESEKYTIEELTLTGELNGTDFRLLRDMAGSNYLGEITEGKLTVLDLSNAKIVAGGEKYLDTNRINGKRNSVESSTGWHYNILQDNELPQYVFCLCNLWIIHLPSSIINIGENSFYYCSSLTRITIPNSVTSIGNSAFRDCNGLTSITIPNSVTSIGSSAFSSCSGLTSITISNSVTSIGYSAFSGCSGLTSITIPNSLTSIGSSVFSGCSGLTSITVASDNQVYDSRDNCNAIIETKTNTLIAGCKNSVIPNSVTSIGSGAFSSFSGLTNITIPNSVTSIGSYAFQSCSGLTSITIPNSVASIGSYAFNYCYNLTIVVSEIEKPFEIAENVFYNYQRLTLFVPTGCKSTYKSTNYWNKFGQIIEASEVIPKRTIHVEQAGTLPNLIQEDEKYRIEELTLTGELNGTDFRLLRDMAGCNYLGEETAGMLKTLDLSNVKIVKGGEKYLDTDHLPGFGGNFRYTIDQDDILPQWVFGCCRILSISIPNSVVSIAHAAFQSCRGLRNITIANSVKSIGSEAFCECSGLTSITIPNSVTSIGRIAFYGCSGLTSVTIPNSVTSIGELPFAFCSTLESISVASDNQVYDSRDNCNAIISTKSNTLIAGCKNTIIPNSVTSLEKSFYGCSGLTSITIPNSVTSISVSAFCYCSALKSIIIPNSVTSIQDQTFRNCSSLSSITFSNSLTNIGDWAFYGCRSLTSITIPNSVNSIGSEAFSWCDSLKSVKSKIRNPYKIEANVFRNLPKDAELTIPNGTKSRYEATEGWNVFSKITEEELADGVVFVGKIVDDKELDFMIISNNGKTCQVGDGIVCATINLIEEKIVIPDVVNGYTVKAIGSNAFQNCSTLKSVTIPSTVTSIGDGAFSGCSGLTSIISRIETPFAINENVFPQEAYSASLYVPLGTKEKYLATAGWKKFKEIIEIATKNGVVFTDDVNGVTVSFKVTDVDNLKCQFGSGEESAISQSVTSFSVPSEAKGLTVASIADNAIANCASLLSVTFPETIETVGSNVLAGCVNLAAIKWNAGRAVPDALTSGVNNPNLLLYVKDKSYAPAAVKNVVANGTADEIVLKETDGGNNFYCPEAFTAKRISFVHNYSMESGYKECRGWETIVLPFDVTTIMSETGSYVVPRSAWTNEDSQHKPFFLYEWTTAGWQPATAIKANIPYIICMPNNENYDPIYQLKGDFEFTGTNVQVYSTDEIGTVVYRNKRFVPNYLNKEASQSMLPLNVNNLWDKNTKADYTEGSAFLRGLRAVRPFEAYMMMEEGMAAPMAIPVFGDGMPTGIDAFLVNNEGVNSEKWYSLDGRKLQGKPTTKGLYIVNGRKVVVK